MRCFTIENGKVSQGIRVTAHTLTNGTVIPVAKVGERGRGRVEAFVPVFLSSENKKRLDNGEKVVIENCVLGQTQKGAHKLIEDETGVEDKTQCLVVDLTDIGFRGGNRHSGDITSAKCASPTEYCSWGSKECIGCRDNDYTTSELPLNVLANGKIAQGDAGRMGSGEELIGILPANKVYRVSRGGRLYGAEPVFYYLFDGATIQVATPEERKILDW